MKKIIILCYDFPPLNSIGAQRPYSWYQNFKSFGLYPIVITNNWTNSDHLNNEVLREEVGEIHYIKPSKSIVEKRLLNQKTNGWIILRKIISFLNAFLKFNYSKIDKTYNLYKYTKSFINENNVDYLLVSGEPFILFKYGYQLSEKYNIPWFADYRDDWIYDHGRLNKGLLDKILKRYEAIYEKKYLKTSSGYSTVSEYILNDIQKRINCKNNIIIENGVELNYLENGKLILNQNNFNIVYTGRFYECSYMQTFKNGFEQFMKSVDNTKIKVFFVGVEKWKCTPYFEVLKIKNKYPNNLEIINTVDIQTATNYQLSAAILLNFIAGDPSKGLIGAKAYSYAATKNPTLVIPEISNKNSPFFPNRDIQTIAVNDKQVFEFLNDKYALHLQNTSLKTNITDNEINSLSRKSNARKLSNFILNTC